MDSGENRLKGMFRVMYCVYEVQSVVYTKCTTNTVLLIYYYPTLYLYTTNTVLLIYYYPTLYLYTTNTVLLIYYYPTLYLYTTNTVLLIYYYPTLYLYTTNTEGPKVHSYVGRHSFLTSGDTHHALPVRVCICTCESGR